MKTMVDIMTKRSDRLPRETDRLTKDIDGSKIRRLDGEMNKPREWKGDESRGGNLHRKKKKAYKGVRIAKKGK